MLDFLGDLRRTHMCGSLRLSDAGKRATIMGWVNKRRDLGNIIFIDVRDRSGVTQAVFDASAGSELHQKAEQLRNEYVVAITGTVRKRTPDTINPNVSTGEVELVAEELKVLNEAKNPPFLPSDTTLPYEEMRLKYRYIDLRREKMQANIEMRHNIALAVRQYLAGQGFFEIETPFMTRSTPGRRARLPGPKPRESGLLLCAAAVAAVVQADPDDLRLRQVFSDRALLPR